MATAIDAPHGNTTWLDSLNSAQRAAARALWSASFNISHAAWGEEDNRKAIEPIRAESTNCCA